MTDKSKSNRVKHASDISIHAFSKLVNETERYVVLQGEANIA